MDFYIDEQTFRDLQVFEGGQSTIFDLFDNCHFPGSTRVLQEMMQTPICELKLLQERQAIIRYFADHPLQASLKSSQVHHIELYRELTLIPLRANRIDEQFILLKDWLQPSNDLFLVRSGSLGVLHLLDQMVEFVTDNEENIATVRYLFEPFISLRSSLTELDRYQGRYRNSIRLVSYLDDQFRRNHADELEEVLSRLYLLDALNAVARTMQDNHLSLPDIVEGQGDFLEGKDVFHPLIDDVVTNDFSIRDKNVCFLTGPNMAGKSTFLKTMGLLVYLTHIGFPVPARQLTISLFKGLFTTINLSDNVNLGYSHFYSEVRRVRDAAQLIRTRDPIVVIFDELFRGTNVKDAYEGTLEVVRALAERNTSLFFISTHIVEVAERLQNHPNLQYQYFTTVLEDDKPAYDYKIKQGITRDRLGLYILEKEGVLELLRSS
jgi:DNA mismatch repair ATPase MutS